MSHLPLSEQLKIDWQVPWLLHLPLLMRSIAQASDLRAALNASVAGLITGNEKPLHFVAQELLPDDVAYESYIFATGGVPTRLNLHDFFNAAIWLTFPKTKAMLNANQAKQIHFYGVQDERGSVRDALTLFDENAAILVTCNAQIANGLKSFDWRASLMNSRLLWGNPFQPSTHEQAVLYPFGHALLEKLTTPRKGICAHTWIVSVEPSWFLLSLSQRLHDLDLRLAKTLENKVIHPKDFCPLPVLGVRHYWADNQDESFYNDVRVFRSGRTRYSSS